MTKIRILGLAVSAVMVLALWHGFVEGDIGVDAQRVWGAAWGRVSLVDLYLGLVIFGAWIAMRESSTSITIAWWMALVLLGNLAAGVYLTVTCFRSGDISQLLLGDHSDG